MEDGQDTKYYKGPRGRVPWMKRYEFLPAEKPNFEPLSALKQQFDIAKIALLGIWHDIRDRED